MMSRESALVPEPAPAPEPPAQDGRWEFPCSQSQLRFWIEEQLAPRNPALNVAVRWRLEGELAQSLLEEAWRRLIARHDPLRTALAACDDQPTQIVYAEIPFALPVVDLRGLPEADRLREADRLAEIEARTPFDIATAPLIRVTRLILAERTSMLLVTAHHAVCDGFSIGILAREMGQICAALGAGVAPFLPDLPIRFGEFAEWEREQLAAGSLDTERAAMRELLRDYKQFELPPDFPRPRRLTSNGAILSILLDRELTDALADLARGNGCTLFMTSLAALFALLYRYTGETDIVLGTQVVGRDEEELESLVGCFINTIALRADVAGDPDFLTLMERTRDMVSDTFDLRALPLQQLVEIANPARDPSRNALFSVNVIFQRSFITNDTYGTFALVDLPSRSAGALYDINIFMVERPEGWRVSCEYNTDLFEAATVSGLLERFETLLRAVVRDPRQTIGRIELLSAADRHALVVAANATGTPYPRDKTLPQLLAEQVARTPEALAVACAGRSLTYARFAATTKRLAREIARRGCAPGTRVGVLLERSIEMVVALAAVLEAGCAYVPLDPKFPAHRLAFIAADAELGATITHTALVGRFAFAANNPILLDALDPLADSEPALVGASGDVVANAGTNANAAARTDSTAYVIYTSGSTGNPKGVAVSQRALVNFLWAMRERPGMAASDTLVAVTTISFDIAGLELFLPLISGAQVVIATETEVVDGQALARLLRESRATVLQATPVTWQLLIDAGWEGDPHLRMLCGGEALPRPLAEQLLARGPELWNMYGPTETTVWSSAGRVTSAQGPVPIGPPIANTQFYILDPQGNLVPPGVAGELHIGGDGVAQGYFRREELTRERFVPDPFAKVAGARMYRTGDIVRMRANGLEFLGRTDQQVKLRGFRIELDEIATLLARQPDVAEAVVISVADSGGDAAIRAFVVAQPGAVVDAGRWPAALRAQLAEFLPNYMLPSAVTVLERLPRTPNGKIDRAALPRALAPAGGAVRELPATPTEVVVAGLVAELLGHAQSDRTDDLFLRGFHSLLAVRLVARIARAGGVSLPLRTIFDEPTIAGIAAAVDAGKREDAPALPAQAPPIVVYHAEAPGPPLVFFHSDAQAQGLYCRRLSAAIGAGQRFIAIAPHGSCGLPVLPTIEAMARDYVERIKRLEPAGPYRIGGHCVGGIIAFEVARQLRARGDRVELLLLVNAYAPHRFSLPGVDWLVRRIGLDASLGWRLREKLCLNLVRFAECVDRGPRAVLRFFRARIQTVGRLRERERQNAIAHPEIVEREAGTPETEAYFAYTIAGFTYHPAPYSGPLTLILSDGEDVSMGDPNRGDPTIGWSRLASDPHLVGISGGHNSPVQERVEELGAIIAQALRVSGASGAAQGSA